MDLSIWFGAHRYIYNELVATIKNDPIMTELGMTVDEDFVRIMREIFTNRVEELCREHLWLLCAPYSIRQNAIRSALYQLKNKDIDKIPYLCRDSDYEIMWVNARDYKKDNVAKEFLKLGDSIKSNVRITCEYGVYMITTR